MNILIWLNIGLDRRTPSEHLLTAICETLIKKGNIVHILQKDTGGNKPELPLNLKEIGVCTTRIKIEQSDRNNLVSRYVEDLKYIIKCKKWIKNNAEFDRVFLQSSNVAGLQVCILRKHIKKAFITFNVQDIFPENAVYSGLLSSKGLAYKILSKVQKYAYKYVDNIITISEDMKDQLVEINTIPDKIKIVYNWSYQDTLYDYSKIDFCTIESLFDKNKFNIVYAGNIGRMQNVEVIIHIADNMKDYQDIAFHIFGEGVYCERLKQMTKEMNLNNITFHSMLDASYAPAIYSIADINVIPLAKNIYRTALPSKTATCLACGKPIIFAIGEKSKFGIFMCKNANAFLTGTDAIEDIKEAILNIRNNKNTYVDNAFFEKYFSKTNNSEKYADIILNNIHGGYDESRNNSCQ